MGRQRTKACIAAMRAWTVHLMLASLVAVAVGAGPAAAQSAWESDTDRLGLDLRGFDLAAADPATCQAACAADPACRAWTYVKPGTTQGPRPRCWLKSGVPPARPAPCCISGVKGAPPPGPGSAAAACFRDRSVRDLDRYEFTRGDMTPQSCVAACRQRGFAFAGVQFSSWCFCANGYGRYGAADNCNMRCAGDAGQICGGEWANSVYSVATGAPVAPGTSVTPPANEPSARLGCFRDQSVRDIDGFSFTAGNMTLQQCVAGCSARGFAFAGAQFATWCFCGNRYGRYGPADNCNMRCAGNPDQICGGEWANSVYATGSGPGPGPGPAPSTAPWQDPTVRSLIDEWLRQVERCTRVPHPGSYIDPWARICGRLATVSADCSMLPDHPPGWDSQQYVWTHNWCHNHYRHRVQDYVRQRLAGTPASALQQCKPEGAACY